MIIAVPASKTGNLDDFFQNKSIQDSLQLGMAAPMPVQQASGEMGVALCFHETSEYIRNLKRPKYGFKYGRFVVGNVQIFKLMLLIVLDDSGAKYSIAEMNINWHDTVTGQDVIAALAAGGPLFLRYYGDQWTCEKLVGLPADSGLENFAQTFICANEDSKPWRAIDFEHASAFVDSKITTEQLAFVELPSQMAVFEETGELCGDEISGATETEDSTEQRHARHSEFLKHNCQPLAAFGWEGFVKNGPGAVHVRQNGQGCKVQYITLAEASGDETFAGIAGQIEKYDPQGAIVVAIDDADDFLSSYIIRLPDLTPKMAFEQGLHKNLQV